MMPTEICISYPSHTECIEAWAVYIPCACLIVFIAAVAIWSTWDR